ncbi:isocitrate lyase/phosphoenolpyruvate mutase family protein [Amycolatopsis sp. 195334CR]|uniref:isocitrate lyase/PEP mutase family protein n=1 Tax=Amycolatopsis sp. 195334CR TaxID=2814588 RepID=UPI001A90BABE|nr:isocitrate lyase/phosphoenolpyruvate mutase family protein [Amycolatopsis sp. 195334CR]MBN6039923.1 isocitrate lyase/phosphoenolpyruvate mutase family protein [Amycolatopsis sp. 195334CR]
MTDFAALHQADTPLLLPNAWDFASAAALHAAGFPAIGTSSLGVAATHGLPDGHGRTRAETLALARSLSRLPCPVTVDIEAGFSDDPGEVADLAAELHHLGIAGINLEDSRPGQDRLADPSDHAELVEAVKTRAPGLFVNARTDTHWLNDNPPPLTEVLDRARQYVGAGADCVFVPGLTDPTDIAALAGGIPVPINILYSPGLDLTELGVGRVSLGSLLFRAALHAATGLARTIRAGEPIPEGIPGYRDIERLIPLTP